MKIKIIFFFRYLFFLTQVHCFAFGIWPAPQPYAIIRAHQNLVEDFSRFLQRDIPNLVYGSGPRQYTLPPHSPNHGLQISSSPQPNPGFQQFNSPPFPNPGFQQFGLPQQPFIFGLPSPLPPQQFLGVQPTFGPSQYSHHQPATFYGPPSSIIGSTLPPQYPHDVIPSAPRPGPPIFIPQSELELPTSPAIGYLPSQSSSSDAPLSESSTLSSKPVASSTHVPLPISPSSIDSRFPSSPSSSVDSVPSANQPTTHTVPSVSSISPQISSTSTTPLPANTDALATSTQAFIQTENDLSAQTSTESASPVSTVEQSTARTEATSTVSDENAQSTTTAANEEIANNDV